MKIYISVYLESLSRKFKFNSTLTQRTVTLRYDQSLCDLSRSVLFTVRNLTDKVIMRIKTHILCSIGVFFLNRGVYEIMWKNLVELGRQQNKTWRMRIAYWTLEAKHTHSEYAIILAFPLQQCLTRTRLNVMLYAHCLSCFKFKMAPHIFSNPSEIVFSNSIINTQKSLNNHCVYFF